MSLFDKAVSKKYIKFYSNSFIIIFQCLTLTDALFYNRFLGIYYSDKKILYL